MKGLRRRNYLTRMAVNEVEGMDRRITGTQTIVSPYSIRPEETVFWLSHRHYFDFQRRR